MKCIPITKGLQCFVDDEDYPLLSLIKWYVGKNNKSPKCYARNDIFGRMHRFLMGSDKHQEVDHIDGNSLNNTKTNLRVCDLYQNRSNRIKSPISKNKYKGVYSFKNKWNCIITFKKKRIFLGIFNTEIEAAKAYDVAAVKYHAEFANLNFPIK